MSDRIAAIRARLDAATEGQWYPVNIEFRGQVSHSVKSNAGSVLAHTGYGPKGGSSHANAEFMAHARQDVETLLSELEAAQARLDKVRALHQCCDDGEQGYRPDGGYGIVAPCCETCGTYGEFTEPWPCATARALGLGEENTE